MAKEISTRARWDQTIQRLKDAHQKLAPRERIATTVAAIVVALLLVWWVALKPAIGTLRGADAQNNAADLQLEAMRNMAANAEAVREEKGAQTLDREAMLLALRSATTPLGETAQLAVQGDRAIVTLRGVAPDVLASWLSQVRINARLVPVQAKLTRASSPTAWSGEVTLGGQGMGSGQ